MHMGHFSGSDYCVDEFFKPYFAERQQTICILFTLFLKKE